MICLARTNCPWNTSKYGFFDLANFRETKLSSIIPIHTSIIFLKTQAQSKCILNYSKLCSGYFKSILTATISISVQIYDCLLTQRILSFRLRSDCVSSLKMCPFFISRAFTSFC